MIPRLFPVLASLLAGACATDPTSVATAFESRPESRSMTRATAAIGGEVAGRVGTGTPDATPSFAGVASWYGPRHHGKPTASGAGYDMWALTAAHPSLPMGTRLRVTHSATGRSVVVTVNDRGPHTGGRILDLSWRAARDLGVLRSGLAMVVAQAVPDETVRVSVPPGSRKAPARPLHPPPADGSLLAGGYATFGKAGQP